MESLQDVPPRVPESKVCMPIVGFVGDVVGDCVGETYCKETKVQKVTCE